jgi:hypothetical protein
MAMVCAQCSQVFTGSERQCPKCGILLLMQQHKVADGDSLPSAPDGRNRWQQTPWGRIVVSVLIAQGLAFCMRTLFTAWFLASGVDGQPETWNTPAGMVWLNVFHAVSLLVCGMLAGANQTRGITSGGLVGLWSGLVFLGIHRAGREFMDPIIFFGQPFLHLLWGLIGGWIGHRIWKPVPLFHLDGDVGTSGFGVPRPAKKLLRGPISVVRVLIGTAIAVAGAVFVRELVDQLLRHSQGMFTIKSYFAEKLVMYQIIALAGLIGGSVAGSSSRNGFKQGLCAGVLAAVMYLGVQLANPKAVLEISLFTAIAIGVTGILGGIFGSKLFPPLVREGPKKAIPY